MQLINLKLQNFNCFVERSIPIQPLTIIQGENGVGKTTVLQAIEFLLNGSIYNPKTGKNQDLIGFFYQGNDYLTVEGKFKLDDETILTVTRRAEKKERNGKNSVQTEIEINPMPMEFITTGKERPTNSDLNRWFEKFIGKVIQIDFRNFFELSPEKRFDFITGYLNSDQSDFAEIKELIKANLPDLNINYSIKGLTFLSHAINEIHPRLLFFKRQLDEMKKTIRGMATVGVTLQKVDQDIVNLKAEKKEVSEKHYSLQEEKTQMAKLESTILSKETEKQELFSELIMQKEIIKNLKPDFKSEEYYDEEIAKLEGRKKEAESLVESLGKEREKLYSKKQDINSQMSMLLESIKNVLGLLRENDKGHCPLCNTKLTPAKRKKIESFKESEETKLVSLEEKDEKILEDIELLDAKRTKAERNLETEVDNINVIVKASNESKLVSSKSEMHNLRQKEIKNLIKVKEADIQMAKEKLAQFGPIDEVMVSLRLRLDYLENQIGIAERDRGLMIAQEEATKRFNDLDEKTKAIEEVETFLSKKSEQEIARAIKPLIEKANLIYNQMEKDSVYNFEIRFQDERKNTVLQPGFRLKSQQIGSTDFIPFEKINEGHQIKVFLSILFSIDSRKPGESGFRLFLLDNMEKISKAYVPSFYEALRVNNKLYDNVLISSTWGYEGNNPIIL